MGHDFYIIESTKKDNLFLGCSMLQRVKKGALINQWIGNRFIHAFRSLLLLLCCITIQYIYTYTSMRHLQ